MNDQVDDNAPAEDVDDDDAALSANAAVEDTQDVTDDDDLSHMVQDDGDIEEEGTAPAEPATATPPAEGTPSAADDATPPVEPAPPTPPSEEGPTPEELQAQQQQQYDARVTGLQEYYTLSDDDISRFDSEPQAVLSNLAARVHAAVEYSLMQQLSQTLPNMMQHVQTQTTEADQARSAFYEPFPELLEYVNENPEAEQTVIRMRQTYVGSLPKDYSMEKANREVAAAAIMAFGLQGGGQAPSPGTAAGVPPTVTTPPRGGQPHKPGRPSVAAPNTRQSTNQFELLDEEFEQAGGQSAVLY